MTDVRTQKPNHHKPPTDKQMLADDDVNRYLLDRDLARLEAENKELTPFHVTTQTVQRSGMWNGCSMSIASAMMEYLDSVDDDDDRLYGLYDN